MIRRATLSDVADVNRWLERDFPGTDFTEVLEEPLHVCLAEGEGGAIFLFRGPGIYEVHVFFEQRGKEVIELSHRMLDVMREQYGARMFWGMIPVESRKVRMFTRLMGWKSLGVKETRNGFCELFVSGEM